MNTDVKDFLSTLRTVRLDWIANEIDTTIGNGKTIVKEFDEFGRRAKGMVATTAPYSDAEELYICVNTLKSYFVDLSETWEKAKATIKGVIEQPNNVREVLSISIMDENGVALSPYDAEYQGMKDQLKILLDRALGY